MFYVCVSPIYFYVLLLFFMKHIYLKFSLYELYKCLVLCVSFNILINSFYYRVPYNFINVMHSFNCTLMLLKGLNSHPPPPSEHFKGKNKVIMNTIDVLCY